MEDDRSFREIDSSDIESDRDPMEDHLSFRETDGSSEENDRDSRGCDCY